MKKKKNNLNSKTKSLKNKTNTAKCTTVMESFVEHTEAYKERSLDQQQLLRPQ